MKVKFITKKKENTEIMNIVKANEELEKAIALVRYLDLTSDESEHDILKSIVRHIRFSQRYRES